jgi:hypothetical protein
MRWRYGFDDEMAARVTKEGGGDIVMDLEQMLMERAVGQAKAMNHANLIRQFREFGIAKAGFVDEAGNPIAAVQEAKSTVPSLGLVSVDHYALTGQLFDKNVADILKKPLMVSESDEGLKAARRLITRNMAWIKGWLTLSPGFHVRNAMSNMLTGLFNHGAAWMKPRDTFEATWATVSGLFGRERAETMMKGIGMNQRRIAEFFGRTYHGKTLEELAEVGLERGVISRVTRGFDEEEMVRGFTGAKGTGLSSPANPLSRNFIALKGSMHTGNVVESIPRFKSFLLDFKELGAKNADNAMNYGIMNAKKIFFDYADVSQFEKKVLKNAIPFYTWMRKNVARQIYNVMHHAETFSIIGKMEEAIADRTDVENLPNWMREQGDIPLKGGVSDVVKGAMKKIFGVEFDDKPLSWWPNAPYTGINELPIEFEMTDGGIPIPQFMSGDDTLHNLVRQAHPALKTVVEWSANYDLFYQSPLGEKRKLRTVAPKVIAVLDGIAKSLGMEGVGAEETEKGVEIDSKWAKVLENNMPVVTQLKKWIEIPRKLIPALDQLFSENIGSVPDYEGINRIFQILSFNMGLKFRELDMDKYAADEAEEILRAAEKRRQRERRRLPGHQARSAEHWRQRTARRRRLGLGA